MHLLEQGQESQTMESQFHLGYQHTDKNVAGTRVKTLLSFPMLRESIPPGQEHPSRPGASLQGSAALCSLYWGRNLLFLSLSYRLVNHWSKHVLLSRSLPCNFWPCVIVKHFLLSCLWSSQCQERSGSLQGAWARAPTMAGSILVVFLGYPGSTWASYSDYSAFFEIRKFSDQFKDMRCLFTWMQGTFRTQSHPRKSRHLETGYYKTVMCFVLLFLKHIIGLVKIFWSTHSVSGSN